MQDTFILKHLKKYIIIPNIDDLPISKPDKKKLSKIKDDYNFIKTLPPSKQKELKTITKAHRLPLESIYLANKDKIYLSLKTQLTAP
ncbi:hypothetical protein AC625_12295 [Peribacillus loiseleuriae]|uniref:Uncharacterized protein n=1 Tax=Peribacillus loiseleuriae TaxID=1679170 RepID=A0A0K9GU63_9BACI|nr:hypothetical protein AC625_12295 [Peribacillus loiseleuriae]